MGKCIYCGESAGLLKSKHSQCEAKEKNRLSQLKDFLLSIEDTVVAAVQQPDEASRLTQLINEGGQLSGSTQEGVREAIVSGWCRSVDKCLEDGIIDEAEELRLMAFKNGFKFTEEDLDRTGAHTRFIQALVIRDLLNGILPERYQISETLPINLQKGETVVWVFMSCSYFEDKTKRQYVGGTRGTSVRVMKGVYYRIGAFKGTTVENTERVLVDKGLVVLTNKHIYFAGPSKSLRVPYGKIVSFLPFEDGVGVIRDAQTAKPQIFNTGEGWFTYNLVTNLAQLSQ